MLGSRWVSANASVCRALMLVSVCASLGQVARAQQAGSAAQAEQGPPPDLPKLVTFPADSGLSGELTLGPTYLNVWSNLITDNGKLGHGNLASLDHKPAADSAVLFYPRIELAYTWAASGWQIHFGNTPLDFYRFDRANVFGVKKNLHEVGVLGLGYVFSAVPDYVWEDPYLLSSARSATRRGSAGARITWDFIGGTPVNFRFTQRHIAIDDEASGSDLGLSESERDRLRRDGTQQVAELNMFVPLGGGTVLLPALTYIRNDRIGAAMSNDAWQLRLTVKLDLSPRWVMLADALGGRLEAHERNPLFGETETNLRYGGALTFKHSPWFGIEPLSLIVRAGSYREDSNIDFYSARIDNVGLFVSFDF